MCAGSTAATGSAISSTSGTEKTDDVHQTTDLRRATTDRRGTTDRKTDNGPQTSTERRRLGPAPLMPSAPVGWLRCRESGSGVVVLICSPLESGDAERRPR